MKKDLQHTKKGLTATFKIIVLLSMFAGSQILTAQNSQTLSYSTVTQMHIISHTHKHTVSVPQKPRVYTVFLAQDFPTIESAANQSLAALDDFEHFGLEALLETPACKKGIYSTQTTKQENHKPLKETIKNKIAPKLNS